MGDKKRKFLAKKNCRRPQNDFFYFSVAHLPNETKKIIFLPEFHIFNGSEISWEARKSVTSTTITTTTTNYVDDHKPCQDLKDP
jgi:hypothetical protein